MRKLLLLIGALLAVHVALLLVRPSGALEPPSDEGLDVGIVFDVGGRGDKSFNDGAYLGATRAAEKLGARVRFIEPGEGSDREAGLRLLAAEGMDLVVGVGFIFTDDLTLLAKEYPNVRFAGVDLAVASDSAGRPIPPPPNLAALKFREEEGSYLVGALAALLSRESRIGDRAYRPTTRVGFVGGMDIPLIHKFEAGYRAGVTHVCPTCTVVAQYAGVTPEAFRNPGRGKELALSQYQSGVNVIFHASGSTGLGVFEAARATGKLAIGVDADQFAEAPGFILTSMVKGVDAAVFDAIQRVQAGTFTGGIQQFGLKEQGVGYVYDANNRALIPEALRARLETLRDSIIAGAITVPSDRQ
ncbi:BMP family lipoprotein [Roseisolibacter agri]|uniref:BMP family ABC transporter substrate-binding protein n=1 Tax=Roseisolibacter agri TaxID=2014610 RepID=A0AA37Q948_9BACT|nr:BMP family ABC transporter substrate-binding protein [Roseisolibacter agri]GLC27007.1 BMP family ABC transporter substrate-binding protein [Roseisolibacter agri]